MSVYRDVFNNLRVILAKCIESVDPGTIIRSALQKNAGSDLLKIRDMSLKLCQNCYIVGFGKAVYKMAVELENTLDGHLRQGIVSIPLGSSIIQSSRLKPGSTIRVFEGAKDNLPDENSYEAAVNIQSLVESCSKDDILFVLISGGGSALLPYPIPPVSLAEKQTTIRLLSSAGADITQINIVRKALSCLKGGKLAKLAYPTTTVALILSDVVGDSLGVIAAGPTVITSANEREEALNVLDNLGLRDSVPENVKKVLGRPDDEVVHENDYSSNWVHNFIVGNNAAALAVAKTEAECIGYTPIVISSRLNGLVKNLSAMYVELVFCILKYLKSNSSLIGFIASLERLRDKFSFVGGIDDVVENVSDQADTIKMCKRRLMLIGGGEPTVLVKGDGLGGRNQELALDVSIRLQDLKVQNASLVEGSEIVFASAGTDGIDGPTDAAGALSYLGLVEDAKAEFNLQATTFLQNNDSYTFFSRFRNGSCHIKTGHTGTNVMDVHFLTIKMPGDS